MIPADLSGLCFLKWYYLPLPRILWELKDMTGELKTNQHHWRMLIVTFRCSHGSYDPQKLIPVPVVPVLPTRKVNKSPSCRTVPALCCGLGSADKHEGTLDFQSKCACPGLMAHTATTSRESAHTWWPGGEFTTSVLLLAREAAARAEKEAQRLPVAPKLDDLP